MSAIPLVLLAPDGETRKGDAFTTDTIAWVTNMACSAMLFVTSHMGPKDLSLQRTGWVRYHKQQTVLVMSGESKRSWCTARTDEQAERFFQVNFSQWQNETRVLSNISHTMCHPAYRRILTLGAQAVPHLLRKLPEGGVAFIAALEDITGENPVLPEHEKSVRLMVEDWNNWGKNHGII